MMVLDPRSRYRLGAGVAIALTTLLSPGALAESSSPAAGLQTDQRTTHSNDDWQQFFSAEQGNEPWRSLYRLEPPPCGRDDSLTFLCTRFGEESFRFDRPASPVTEP